MLYIYIDFGILEKYFYFFVQFNCFFFHKYFYFLNIQNYDLFDFCIHSSALYNNRIVYSVLGNLYRGETPLIKKKSLL